MRRNTLKGKFDNSYLMILVELFELLIKIFVENAVLSLPAKFVSAVETKGLGCPRSSISSPFNLGDFFGNNVSRIHIRCFRYLV